MKLRPVSRILAKGKRGLTRDAFELLPEALKTEVEYPDKAHWDRLVAEHADDSGCALVEVGKLALIHGLKQRTKLTPKQSRSLAQTAGYVGLVIEPDARITGRPYGWEDIVALERSAEGPALPTDNRYLGAALMLELAVYVAAANEKVDDDAGRSDRSLPRS